MNSSKFEAFQNKALPTAMMRAITGGEIYPNTYGATSQTVKTYDAQGHETGCKERYDTVKTDRDTLAQTTVYGDWQQCGTTTTTVGK